MFPRVRLRSPRKLNMRGNQEITKKKGRLGQA